MSQSLAKLVVHFVFSTKDRRPFLRDDNLRAQLHDYLGGILRHNGSQPLAAGGTADHVHVLTALSRTCSAADAVKELKRGSTLWLKAKAPDLAGFNWQSGYGVFSLGFSQIAPAMKYVARQAEHHQKVSFKDEFLGLLRRYEIAADERYLWD